MRTSCFWIGLSVLGVLSGGQGTAHACKRIELGGRDTLVFSGVLTLQVFPGPPNFTDVRTGDAPEPVHILRLDHHVCASGSEFAPQGPVDRVQVDAGDGSKAERLRTMSGHHVRVTMFGVDGATTGHHHAPLVGKVEAIGLAK